ncbi:YceI family protein [Streptomyces zagrosensis]|uniref:Polyisoprenoid-binding protein YceI n=1 Tax=Streptomyces zagrosensis TaxID=1042984 RepID=A0A7W9QII6_9ACTN|nr:YceI family protein [Streptomyces zagrosensis]MBB5939837.1 polyisoprenoid-binding protein YceI [Streptomyces zagrosensis]
MPITTRLGDLTGNYALDTGHTRIGFVARHTMSTRVRGHFGEFEGDVHLNGDHPTTSRVRLVIQAKSIHTHNRQRDDLLRGKFLDLDNHPAITFTSATVEQVDETHYKLTGDLTARGVAKPVTLDVELTGGENDPQGNLRVGFRASTTINRNDWGVNWNAATTVFISPKVTLEFDVTAIRRQS